MNSFIHELITKLVPLLRGNNFKSHILDCSVPINESSDVTSSLSMNLDPNEFETRLIESVALSPLLQLYRNSTFNLEYYLKVTVFGRDGNELRMPIDESVVLTELAEIDNSAFRITPNISLKSPRRFFRIGIAQV